MVCNVNGESVSIITLNIRLLRKLDEYMSMNSGDDELLLVVCRLNPQFETMRFDVFKMNRSRLSWDRVENLGNRLLFIGRTSSFSLSGSGVRRCLQI